MNRNSCSSSTFIFLISLALLLLLKQGSEIPEISESNKRLSKDYTCIEARDALSHTLERIRNSALKFEPFPHLIVDQIFTDTYYAHILRNIINATESTLFKKRGPLKPRYSLDLVNAAEQSRQAKQVNLKEKILFWKCHYQTFGASEFTEHITNSFSSVLNKRLGRDYYSKLSRRAPTKKPRFFQRMNLVQDRDKYFISPHTDVAEKFITMLFYLAPIKNDFRLRDAGTLLLAPSNPRDNSKSNDVCDLVKFRATCRYVKFQGKYYRFKQCEFEANRLVAFAPCHSAWHAVPLQNLDGTPRDTIQSFVGSTSAFPLGKC